MEVVLGEGRTAPAFDVAVVGGGLTGAIAALSAADAGWRTALIAPDAGHDTRTTALMMPAVALLQALEVWSLVADDAAPLVTMRLVDDTGRLPRAPEIAFDAGEIDLDQFGFNIPNDALNRALAACLAAADVTRIDAAATRLEGGPPARIETAAGPVSADFVVGADGFHSLVRAEMGFSARRWSYDQSAFVTTLGHERPHGDTSVEFHKPDGPFTLVPLPGERCSLVWVARPHESARRAALEPDALVREIEAAAHHILGAMTLDGPRGTFAIEGMVASHFGRGNVVLVGEAGHRFPPIGAQGLNLGLRDVATLRRLLGKARIEGDLAGVAEAYDRRRRLDVGTRTLGVDLLNRSLLTGALPVSALRAVGVAAVRNVGPIRRTLMRLGVG